MNTLLSRDTPVPFEFLINGTFLRTSLDEYLTTHGISAETTLEVEYVRAQLPPSTAASYEHDDWVSAVDVLSGTSPAGGLWASKQATLTNGEARILSASYDGLLRLWDLSGNIVATSPANTAATSSGVTSILSAKFISPTTVVSAGFDARVRIWDYAETNSASGTFAPRVDFHAHTHAVNALAVDGPTSRILSASADGTAALFSSILTSSTPAAPANLLPRPVAKRRKIVSSAPSNVRTAGASQLLTGHTASVTSIIFAPRDASVAYTTSSDRTLRTWDLETGACVTTLTPCGPHTGLSAVAGMKALGLLAIGHVGRAVALVDPRALGGQRSAQASLVGHKGAITGIAAAPEGKGEYGLVSSSLDGTCRVWDVRSTRSALEGGLGAEESGKVGEASYVVKRAALGGEQGGKGGGKVFGVVWDGEVGIVSGGEDGRVQIDR